MNPNELMKRFPLEPEWKEFFEHTVMGVKESLNSLVAKEIKMELPEHVLSQACQIIFYIPMDLYKLLREQYKPLVGIVKRYYSNQLPQIKDNLVNLMNNSFQKGIPKDNLLEYIAFYIDDAHSKFFPNQPIILGL